MNGRSSLRAMRLALAQRFRTEYSLADGRSIEEFSPFNQATVRRHFQWMRNYSMDGAFVQRFISSLRDPKSLRYNNTIRGRDHGPRGLRLGNGRLAGEYIIYYLGCRQAVHLTARPECP